MKNLTYIVLITASLATSSVYAIGVGITGTLKATVTSQGSITNTAKHTHSKAIQNLASVVGDEITIGNNVELIVKARTGGITNKAVGVRALALQQIASIAGTDIKVDNNVDVTVIADSFLNSAQGTDSIAIQDISSITGQGINIDSKVEVTTQAGSVINISQGTRSRSPQIQGISSIHANP